MKKQILIFLLFLGLLAPLPAQILGPQLLSLTYTTVASGSGATIAAGARSVLFIVNADFDGTIGGMAFNGGKDASLPFPAMGEHTYPAINYTRSGGTLRIIETR